MTSNNPENGVDSAVTIKVNNCKSGSTQTAHSFYTNSRLSPMKKTYTVRNDFQEKIINGRHSNNNSITSNRNDGQETNRIVANKSKKLSFNHDEDDVECVEDLSTADEKAILETSLLASDSDGLLNNVSSIPIKSKLNSESHTVPTKRGISHHDVDTSDGRRSESDDPMHDDLDYDEDSIKGSPSGSKTQSKRRVIDANLKSTVKKSSSSASLSQSDIDEGELDSPMSVESNDNIVNNDSRGDESLGKSDQTCVKESKSEDQTSDGTQNIRNNRIKSFINLNHLLDEKRETCPSDGLDDTRISDDFEKLASRKSYRDLLRCFFKDAIYFQIKSINYENVELSKSMGVWSTSMQNEQRLNSAFHRHRNVILIFSVQQSGAFQGFARMISESLPPTRPVPWVLPERFLKKSLGGIFKLDWLCSEELSFSKTQTLFNPFNENKPVKIARDGQVLEPRVAKKLCKLFPRDSKRRLISSIRTLKSQKKRPSGRPRGDDNLYPLAYRQPDRYGDHIQQPRHHPRHHHSFHPYAHPAYMHGRPPHQAYYPPPMPDYGYLPAHDYVNFLYSQVISHNSTMPFIPPGASRRRFADFPVGPGPIGRGKRLEKHNYAHDPYMYGHYYHPHHPPGPHHYRGTTPVASSGSRLLPPGHDESHHEHLGSTHHGG